MHRFRTAFLDPFAEIPTLSMLCSFFNKDGEHHIVHCGVTEFIVGNYGGFDRMAARAVISAKALYPGITLLLLLSYTGFTERIRYIFRLVI